ncbi:MAG: hypothetical protein O9312_08720 [Hylemonella sp.]|nr:hypothetical protein [Hylemonella sp.]
MLAVIARTLANTVLSPPASSVEAAILLDEAPHRLVRRQKNHRAAEKDANTNSPSPSFAFRKVRMNKGERISGSSFNWANPIATVIAKGLFNGKRTTCNLELTKPVITQFGIRYARAWN